MFAASTGWAGQRKTLCGHIWPYFMILAPVSVNQPVPGWYLGGEHWAEGLATAYFARLAPAAMACFSVMVLRTRSTMVLTHLG